MRRSILRGLSSLSMVENGIGTPSNFSEPCFNAFIRSNRAEAMPYSDVVLQSDMGLDVPAKKKSKL